MTQPLATEAPVPVFVNLGCGPAGGPVPAVFAGWREIRVDADPGVAPDIVADITDLAALADGSAQAIWCSHCLEHVFEHQVGAALAEMRRVLAPAGVLVVLTPDLQTIAQVIASDRLVDTLYESPAGPISAHDMLYGHGRSIAAGRLHMAHRCGFTPSAMAQRLGAAGFEHYALFRRPAFELVAVASSSAWSDAARDGWIAALRS